jgi:thiamine monophosphate synthase
MTTRSPVPLAQLFLVVALFGPWQLIHGWATISTRSRPTTTFPKLSKGSSPFLVVITHEWSCDSDEAASLALNGLKRTLEHGGVDLISIRVGKPDSPTKEHIARVFHFIQSVLELSSSSSNKCRVVVTSDWMEQGIQAKAHGIHFKEAHRHWIPNAVDKQQRHNNASSFIIGTSAHTIDSALDAVHSTFAPDYIICGTCYPTKSHPEKGNDVEGPAFPAQVKAALVQHSQDHIPVIAIGGLDIDTIPSQVKVGAFVPNTAADGVAVIRCVLDADDPALAVESIRMAMGD